jgi:hypothetical protein
MIANNKTLKTTFMADMLSSVTNSCAWNMYDNVDLFSIANTVKLWKLKCRQISNLSLYPDAGPTSDQASYNLVTWIGEQVAINASTGA